MRVVLTLVVRDEQDILREHLDYHLDAGVDLIIVTDHRSVDGTSETLESYPRDGVVVVLREDGEYAQQAVWQTHMARLASTTYAADWVINSDADEFWWPRGASLKETLAAVPSRYGVVCGLQHNFISQRNSDGWFIERVTERLALAAPINDPATAFRLVTKVAHRGSPTVVVQKGGGHQVFGIEGGTLRAWYPLDVLHFPFRSRVQSMRKYRKTWTGWQRNLRGDIARARQVSEIDSGDAVWDRIALNDAARERGLAEGRLVTDVRLRDAFRRMRGSDSESTSVSQGAARNAATSEAAAFEEAEVVRLQRWADEIQSRVSRLEGPPAAGSRPMKLVQTLVVRDEADIVGAQIDYHLSAGVDFVIASDHESHDGTTEILESYASDGVLRRIPVRGAMRDGPWRTHMARLAAVEHGADWVINTDADEFWMPSEGTLEDVFAAVHEPWGVVYALSRHFVPRPDDGVLFAERMLWCLALGSDQRSDEPVPAAPEGRPSCDQNHRDSGSHTVASRRWRAVHNWHPADVLHFPFRSLEQWENKGVRRARGDKPLGQYVTALRASEGGRSADRFHALVVDGATLERGRAAGWLVADYRVQTRSALFGVSVKRAARSRSTKGACPRAQRFRTPIWCGSSVSSTVSHRQREKRIRGPRPRSASPSGRVRRRLYN